MKSILITSGTDGRARVFAGRGFGFYLEPLTGTWPCSVVVDGRDTEPMPLTRARSLYYGEPFGTLELRDAGAGKTWRAWVFEHAQDGIADGSPAAQSSPIVYRGEFGLVAPHTILQAGLTYIVGSDLTPINQVGSGTSHLPFDLTRFREVMLLAAFKGGTPASVSSLVVSVAATGGPGGEEGTAWEEAASPTVASPFKQIQFFGSTSDASTAGGDRLWRVGRPLWARVKVGGTFTGSNAVRLVVTLWGRE